MTKPRECVTEVVSRIADIAPADWDACANPDPALFNPFLSHAFLRCLEESGSVGGRTGWTPRHLVLKDATGEVAACAPCYVKSHSKGEYVFDYAWADAYLRAGGDYYPKLQIAVPFTPVPGRRLLTKPGPASDKNEAMLAAAAAEVVQRSGLSGVHITFLTEGEWQRLGTRGYLQRTGQQFHWANQGYATFEDFLGSLASRKRKTVRKEREQARVEGLDISWVTGRDITEAHWDAFFAFYMETGSRKWGRPYLNRVFFSLLGDAMADRCLLVMVRRGQRFVGGALNMIGGDCLYGRYWGAIEHHPCLHFEVCYYQAIEYAIQHKLARVEAGAQGEHKIARGYLPVRTYSAHFIADPALRRAIADFLRRERLYVEAEGEELAKFAPFRKDAKVEEV
ncbi:MAG TPA: GNAT family N-acetyltransferase [Hyphomicrobiaceae bacterium]|nr:GNAT family N-acetyltransferase [Hyphomicrobiaceae bacterium]